MTTSEELHALFQAQHTASRKDQYVDLIIRLDRLGRAIDMMVAHADEFAEAMSADFGNRSIAQSLAIDVGTVLDALKFARKYVSKWMAPERRGMNFPTGLFGAKLEVRYQPLGVVGIIGAWNFPVATLMAPLAGVLAAGNRAILKPSELMPRTAALLSEAIAARFTPDEVAVISGGPDLGKAMTALPFDHLVFTGGTETARHIMRSAADHLMPLTLELGGKSPVIVGKGADSAHAARQIMFGKLFNAGQACVAPDYALVPRGMMEAMEAAFIQQTEAMFAGFADNPDYSSIATDVHYTFLTDALQDAKAKGARETVIGLAGDEAILRNGRKILPRLLLDVSDDMKIMQAEIFGPILPVLAYDVIEDAIAYVNGRSRPLALYYFGKDKTEQAQVLNNTLSGGVTINDTILHTAQEGAPFGGVGPSGLGHYRGIEGFKEFSHARTVMIQSRINVGALLRPPYSAFKLKALKSQIRR